jgi:hypothetical protein
MKPTKNLILTLGMAVLTATSAFAAPNKGSLQITSPVKINGTQLKPGDYSVKWEGTGSNVQLSILQGRSVVTTATAHVVELPQKSTNDAAVITTGSDGTKNIAEIHFIGKKEALALGDGMSKANMSGSN